MAVIANDERVAVLAHGVGCRSVESATGATLQLGERVVVRCGDETWLAVVRRRHPTLGALVEELLTQHAPW
jgi:hypothetical protein